MSLWYRRHTSLRVEIHSREGSKMNCQKVPDLIHSYVDHELDLVQTSEIERHLEQCEECDLVYRRQIALRSSLQDTSFYYRAPADLKAASHRPCKKKQQQAKTSYSYLLRRYLQER